MKASKIASPIIRLAFGPEGIPLAQMTRLVMLVEQVIIKHDLAARSAECVRRAPLTGSLDSDTARFSTVIGEVIGFDHPRMPDQHRALQLHRVLPERPCA